MAEDQTFPVQFFKSEDVSVAVGAATLSTSPFGGVVGGGAPNCAIKQPQKPSPGRVVLFTMFAVDGEQQMSNGLSTHPAIVTRCWGPSASYVDGSQQELVNLMVLPDMGGPYPQGSVYQAPNDEPGVPGTWCFPPRVG